MNNRVIILGCGHGGMALAADLKLKGAQVALWSDPEHASRFDQIVDKREIIFQDANRKKSVKLDLLSCDFSEVIKFGNIIYNCTPMVAHVPLFKKLSASLGKADSPKLFINLSGIFSGIDQFLSENEHQAAFQKIRVYDTASFPYACRADDGNSVTILGRKSELAIAPLFPSEIFYLNLIPDICRPARLHAIENSIKLGLMGTNAIFHPATVLFNARLIENGCSFLFYKEGISKNTSLLHEALDKERIALAKKLGYSLMSSVEYDNIYYGTDFASNYDFSLHSDAHKKIKSPTSLNHRFITEDIAFGLVPLLTLGKLYKVPLSNIESMINIFSTIMDVNYTLQGRNLHGISRELIRELSWPGNIANRISA